MICRPSAGLLIANDAADPSNAPELPLEITEVWALSPWDSGFGFRWSSATRRWRKFSKRLRQIFVAVVSSRADLDDD